MMIKKFLSIIAEAESQSSKRRNHNAHRNSIAESWQLDWEAPRAEGLKTTNLWNQRDAKFADKDLSYLPLVQESAKYAQIWFKIWRMMTICDIQYGRISNFILRGSYSLSILKWSFSRSQSIGTRGVMIIKWKPRSELQSFSKKCFWISEDRYW